MGERVSNIINIRFIHTYMSGAEKKSSIVKIKEAFSAQRRRWWWWRGISNIPFFTLPLPRTQVKQHGKSHYFYPLPCAVLLANIKG